MSITFYTVLPYLWIWLVDLCCCIQPFTVSALTLTPSLLCEHAPGQAAPVLSMLCTISKTQNLGSRCALRLRCPLYGIFQTADLTDIFCITGDSNHKTTRKAPEILHKSDVGGGSICILCFSRLSVHSAKLGAPKTVLYSQSSSFRQSFR